MLASNLDAVRARIAAAAARAGRAAADVTLIAVTKYVGPEVAAAMVELGQRDLGESRPQELWRKAAALGEGPRWHLIGHLQTNKARRTVSLRPFVHSLDRNALAESLSAETVRANLEIEALLEIKLTDEESKGGIAPSDAVRDWESWRLLPGLRIVGLMGMAGESDDPEAARPAFRRLRELRDEIGSLPGGEKVRRLSMGMSGDFEVAIEEGATMVRVGSALFSGLSDLGRGDEA
jgi:pyridoxal phosphate enzyme (YggS family)